MRKNEEEKIEKKEEHKKEQRARREARLERKGRHPEREDGVRRKFHFNFVGNQKKYYSLSVGIMVIGLAVALIFGVKMDIMFSGGTVITYSYTGSVDENAAHDAIYAATRLDINVTQSAALSGSSEALTVTTVGNIAISNATLQSITKALQDKFPDNSVALKSSNSVGPTLGRAFFGKGLSAMGLACILLVVYIGFRFRRIGGVSSGAMALVSLVHDMIIVFCLYVILRIPLDEIFVAVILTVLGYSLNDTVVIFDRIRENRRLEGGDKAEFGEIVDRSINQTLSRTIITALCTFLAVATVAVVAAVYGLETITRFAVPMAIGVVSGSYSSICIAGPLWVDWQRHKIKRDALKEAEPKAAKGKAPAKSGASKPAKMKAVEGKAASKASADEEATAKSDTMRVITPGGAKPPVSAKDKPAPKPNLGRAQPKNSPRKKGKKK